MRTIRETFENDFRLQTVGDPRTDDEVRKAFGPHIDELQDVEDAWRARTGQPLLLAQTECAFDSDLADVIIGMRVVALDYLRGQGMPDDGWQQTVVEALALLDPVGRTVADPDEYGIELESELPQDERRERFEKLIASFGMTLDDYDDDDDAEENPRPFLRGEKRIERFVCVTWHQQRTFFLPDFPTRDAAEARAVEYVHDDLWEESPLAVVDLDTGTQWNPNWNSLVFETEAERRAR